MKTISCIALASLLATSSLAAPSPKLPSIRNPRIAVRPKVSDYRINAAENATLSNSTATPTVSAPKRNVWISLTDAEAADVVAFLHDQIELNLTASADAGSWDNMISTIDLAQPNKTAAVDYIAGTGPAPPRFAKVNIMFGATTEPYLEDFVVGPLPVTNLTTYAPDNWSTTKGTSKIRNYDADPDLTSGFWYEQAATADDIIIDLLGYNSSHWDIWGIDPLWQEEVDGEIHTVNWLSFFGIPTTVFDGETVLPQGLYFKVDQTGRDPSKWFLVGWLYNGIYYTSTDDFRAAWKKADFVKAATRNEPGDWFSSDRVGPELKYDERAPPMQVQPDGQRFAVDAGEKYVEWMDFSFYFTFTRDTGLRLYNIEYKGQRIIYELGLQEPIAHYAGNDPVQSGTAYLDTYYGFGPFAFNLLPGYDCPAYSVFLNATFHADEVSTTHKTGICLYESDAGYLIQRHSNANYVSATKNTMFTLRSVSTVGNYDYTFSYNFYLDGSVEFLVMASGYIQAAYYAQNGDYGYQIEKGLSGSMHDHSLNFKIDMDILGTANTLAIHSVVPANVSYPWSNTTRSTMKLQRSEISNEDHAKLNWQANAQGMFVVVNKNETNPYGEPRGYIMKPSRGGAGMHLTIQNSSNLYNSQSFATHALYVTKHHDNEQKSAHAANDYDPRNPVIDFSKFFNSESLDQEDIVLWANLGMHHVPHTGDMPNTVQTTAQSGLIISPHNYLLSDPSRQSSQQVRINYNSTASGQVTDVLLFGGEVPSGTVNVTSQQTQFWDYVGDVNVRKRPYDPEHPYNDTISVV